MGEIFAEVTTRAVVQAHVQIELRLKGIPQLHHERMISAPQDVCLANCVAHLSLEHERPLDECFQGKHFVGEFVLRQKDSPEGTVAKLANNLERREFHRFPNYKRRFCNSWLCCTLPFLQERWRVWCLALNFEILPHNYTGFFLVESLSHWLDYPGVPSHLAVAGALQLID